MGKEISLLLLFISLLVQGNILSLSNNVPHQCKNADLINFIKFPLNHIKCLQVIFNENDNEVTCILKRFGLNFILLETVSFRTLKRRDISTEVQKNCQTFLIVAGTISDAEEIFRSDQERIKQFFPFSKIYFYISDNFNDRETDIRSISQLKQKLIKNALFGYMFKVENDEVVVRDILANGSKRSTSSYIPSDLLHPIVDTHLAKDNFRISLFNCPPFTFYSENASYNTIINEMDGTEFRLVKDVTKNWHKTYNLRDFSRDKLSPYDEIPNDLSNGTSQMGMCSIWLQLKNYELLDLTTFYDQTCVTFIVPKPEKLNEAIAIYTALSTQVWMLIIVMFLLSIILINLITKIEKTFCQRDAHYIDLSHAIIETISILTSHSMNRLPSNSQTSAHMLLASWILFSMWIDICYTTAYTSRLTSPSYEKPIDTVKQFLDRELYFCSEFFDNDTFQQFRWSVNEDYRKLSYRFLTYENNWEKKRLIDDRKCGMFVQRNSEAVSLTSSTEDLVDKVRMMNDCVTTHFTVFAFQKYSPYTKLFNFHIRRYQEYGLIRKFYLDFSRGQLKYKPLFINTPERSLHRQINLVNVSGSFLLLCTGLILSIISFCGEIIVVRLIN